MRHAKDPGFRLCHYFDLIAGTSTGAIIAAALALGMTVAEVIGHYQKLGREVFLKGWLRKGIVRARRREQTHRAPKGCLEKTARSGTSRC
jgi:patatin-like phospholipase/acyl hydrolase